MMVWIAPEFRPDGCIRFRLDRVLTVVPSVSLPFTRELSPPPLVFGRWGKTG